MPDTFTLRLGTRKSRLALVQTGRVARALSALHPSLNAEIVEIETSGDWRPEQGEIRLDAAQGGKGLFVKEIQQALLEGRIDAAVHSLKDVPSVLPAGLEISHVLPRENPGDAFVSDLYADIREMPDGARIGTASLRRACQLRAMRPGIDIAVIRGNVPTRIAKMEAGQVEALVLARAGLERLEMAGRIRSVFSPRVMIPACGQGVICIETRQGDRATGAKLDPLNCARTSICVQAERAALAAIGGNCHTPFGAFADLEEDGRLRLELAAGWPDGSRIWTERGGAASPDIESARMLGTRLGESLRRALPEALVSSLQPGSV